MHTRNCFQLNFKVEVYERWFWNGSRIYMITSWKFIMTWNRLHIQFTCIVFVVYSMSSNINNNGARASRIIKHWLTAVDEKQLDNHGKYYLAYLIEENDIFKKKICECISKLKCHNRVSIQLARWTREKEKPIFRKLERY